MNDDLVKVLFVLTGGLLTIILGYFYKEMFDGPCIAFCVGSALTAIGMATILIFERLNF